MLISAIVALSGVVGFLFKLIIKELNECKRERKELYAIIASDKGITPIEVQALGRELLEQSPKFSLGTPKEDP